MSAGASRPATGLDQVRLMGLLGEGGMAQVFLGHHDVLGRQVAVKRLRPHLASLEQARERMRSEAAIARAVRHDHVVDVLDLVTDASGDTFLVMELLAGEPLSARLARGGALPLSETLVIALQIADAMSEVHRRGIIHRDLKTENVLVGVDHQGALLSKLIDFGVAELVSGPDGTVESTTVVGTPESMSPEQAAAGTIDRRSDIYSFGVLVYEMVTGAPPFQCDDLPSLLVRLSREAPLPPSQAAGAQKQLLPVALEQLVLQCLAKSPDDRPQDMLEVLGRLERIAADYRTLHDAVDLALVDRSPLARRSVKQALLVVEPPVPPAPSAVRAIGTNDSSQVAAAPRRSRARWASASVRGAAPLATEGSAAATEPSDSMDAATEDDRAVEPRRRHRLLKAAGMGLILAVGLGTAGVMGSRAWAGSPVSLELPWQR